MYKRWGHNLKFLTTEFSNQAIKFRLSSSFSCGWWWGGVGCGGMNECDIKLAKLTGYIVPRGQYRGQRATKLLAVHLKLSSNSNPSFSAAQPIKIWHYSTHIQNMSVHLQYLPHLQCQRSGSLVLVWTHVLRSANSSSNHTWRYNMQRMSSSTWRGCCRRAEARGQRSRHMEVMNVVSWWGGGHVHVLMWLFTLMNSSLEPLTGQICTQWAERDTAHLPKWLKSRGTILPAY